MERVRCKCGKTFADMEAIAGHWRNNTSETTGQAHYRVNLDGTEISSIPYGKWPGNEEPGAWPETEPEVPE
jgi:hypothetical protein